MRISIFHYHLNPGGVTRIIESQVVALKKLDKSIEIRVVAGHCSNPDFYKNNNVELIVNPDLNYFTVDRANTLHYFNSIYTFLKSICKKEDVFHVHNLNLGKNPLVTLAFSELAYEGYTILNHAHDFSEDRHENQIYLERFVEEISSKSIKDVMYPKLKNYRFIVLNSFDATRLSDYGAKNVSILANPVELSASFEGNGDTWRANIVKELGLDRNKKIITYPVRVIRRKNIAEFVLLATIFKDDANWVVTQPPKNPKEIEHYVKWKDFCVSNNIKIFWEAGTKTNFEKLISVSDFCVTTSIQEGFGMVYLEPWLLNTPVIGRNIEMVTKDIKESGINFPLLYDNLSIDENSNEIAGLKIEEQMKVVLSIKNKEDFRLLLIEKNPYLKDFLKPVNKRLIKKNIEVILEQFSLEKYGIKLYEIYRRITE